ncbi:hypothetical protein [Bradyrhizobium arachidis]|uniref:hypothetical protein n=1 Tax=Bradyrhizobium arachidis TaxID=858423 RepID=UPI0021616DBD|nr:hypothetical protein [Bradyrhizobium arachidis]UVO30316.1 hypothetical protein KUF59_06125 [Bradyrhizobium arachidis]
MTQVIVYKSLLYESKEDEPLISRRMATRHGAAALGELVIKGTGYVIDATHLEPGNQWTALVSTRSHWAARRKGLDSVQRS